MFGTCPLCRRKAAISAILSCAIVIMALVTRESGSVIYILMLIAIISTTFWLMHVLCARKGVALVCQANSAQARRQADSGHC